MAGRNRKGPAARARRGRENVRLKVRRARPSDRDAILKMSDSIWGGTDYMPLVWDRWLDDEKGVLLTATWDGVPVGVSKVSVISPGEVWLEGLRLHPDLQGKGLVSQINRVSFREAMKLKPRVIRYATGAGNAVSRHLGEKRGFWMVARTNWLWGKSLPGDLEAGREARPDELAEVMQYVRGTRCFEAAGGLCPRGWKFPELTSRRLRKLISHGSVLIARGRRGIHGSAIYDVGEIDDDVCLGFLDGPRELQAELARDVLRIARRTGRDESSAMLPVGEIAETARSAGYSAIIPANAVVYELHPRGFHEGEEPFESVVSRTLRSASGEVADSIVDVLMEKSPGKLNRENVRDFVMRDVIPDTLRETYAAIENVQYRLESWGLRAILRAITRHFMGEYGVAGDSIRTTRSTVHYSFLGKRVASLRLGKRSLTLTVGPTSEACFEKKRSYKAERVSFSEDAFDPSSGRYSAVTMVLSKESQLPDAISAIDCAMKAASRGARR